MKLQTCGLCGLKAIQLKGRRMGDAPEGQPWLEMQVTYGCPVHNIDDPTGLLPSAWNVRQFSIRTGRINATAQVLATGHAAYIGSHNIHFRTLILDAEDLIEQEDLATQARWAKAQQEPS